MHPGIEIEQVKLATLHEKCWGRLGDVHICVTEAMQRVLKGSWKITAIVFHDKAPQSFRAATRQEMHSLLVKLEPCIMAAMHPNDCIAIPERQKSTSSLAHLSGRTEMVHHLGKALQCLVSCDACKTKSSELNPNLFFWRQVILPADEELYAGHDRTDNCNTIRYSQSGAEEG